MSYHAPSEKCASRSGCGSSALFLFILCVMRKGALSQLEVADRAHSKEFSAIRTPRFTHLIFPKKDAEDPCVPSMLRLPTRR
eukprot:2500733-Rhodomonas_salina.3